MATLRQARIALWRAVIDLVDNVASFLCFVGLSVYAGFLWSDGNLDRAISVFTLALIIHMSARKP